MCLYEDGYIDKCLINPILGCEGCRYDLHTQKERIENIIAISLSLQFEYHYWGIMILPKGCQTISQTDKQLCKKCGFNYPKCNNVRKNNKYILFWWKYEINK